MRLEKDARRPALRARPALILLALVSVAQQATAQNPLDVRTQAAATRALLDGPELHVVLCGTSGPLYSPTRSGPCTAVLAGGQFFIVDLGAGAVASSLRLNLPLGDLTAVLITHFHSDHMAEVGEMNFTAWTQGSGQGPLRILGPEGIKTVVEGFTRAYELDLGYRVAHHGEEVMPSKGAVPSVQTIGFEGEAKSAVVWDEGGVKITAFLVDHPPIVPAVGYRFDYKGRSVVISGDTKRSQTLIEQSKEADLLIHEVISDAVINMAAPALRQAGRERGARILQDALTNHTLPADAFALAAEANVRALVFSHLVPPLPAGQAERAFGQGREAFGGDFVIGEDGMHFILPPQSKEIRRQQLGDV